MLGRGVQHFAEQHAHLVGKIWEIWFFYDEGKVFSTAALLLRESENHKPHAQKAIART